MWVLYSIYSIILLLSTLVECTGGLQEQVQSFNKQHEQFQVLKDEVWIKLAEFAATTVDGPSDIRNRVRIFSKYMSPEYVKKNIRNIVEGDFVDDVEYLAENWAKASNTAMKLFPLLARTKPLKVLNDMRNSPLVQVQPAGPDLAQQLGAAGPGQPPGQLEVPQAAREQALQTLAADTEELREIDVASRRLNDIQKAVQQGYRAFHKWFLDDSSQPRTVPQFPFSANEYIRHLVKKQKTNAWWKQWVNQHRTLKDNKNGLKSHDWPDNELNGPHELIRRCTSRKYLEYAISSYLVHRFSGLLSQVVEKEGIPSAYLTPTGFYLRGPEGWAAIAPYSAKQQKLVDRARRLVKGQGRNQGFGVNLMLERALGMDKDQKAAHANALLRFERNLIADGLPRVDILE